MRDSAPTNMKVVLAKGRGSQCANSEHGTVELVPSLAVAASLKFASLRAAYV